MQFGSDIFFVSYHVWSLSVFLTYTDKHKGIHKFLLDLTLFSTLLIINIFMKSLYVVRHINKHVVYNKEYFFAVTLFLYYLGDVLLK